MKIINILIILLVIFLSFGLISAEVYQSTYRKWDNTINPIGEMNDPFIGNYPYKAVEYDNYYTIITFEDNFNIPKRNYLTYVFTPNKISPIITISDLSKLENIAIDHNLSVKYIPISGVLNIDTDNIIKFSKNWFWDNEYVIRDSGFEDIDQDGEFFINYSYFNNDDGSFKVVNDELRFYARKDWFINTNYPVTINFNSFTYQNISVFQSCWNNTICEGTITNGTSPELTIISYNKTPLLLDLQGQWLFNDNNSDLDDSSGNEKNLVNTGSIATNGYYGIGRFFDDIDDKAVRNADSICTKYPCTINTWVKPLTRGRVYVSLGSDSTDLRWMFVSSGGSDNHYVGRCQRRDNSSAQNLDGNTEIPLNTWSMITCLFNNNTNNEIYVNGVFDGVSSTSVSFELSIDSICIGCLKRPIDSSFANATIDEVRVFNRSLSSNEILNLYNKSFTNSSNLTTSNFNNTNNTIITNFKSLVIDTSFNIYYNGTGNFLPICTSCLNNTGYNIPNNLSGQIRIELISNFNNTPEIESFKVFDSMNIIELTPINNTIVNLNGTEFDQEFNVTATGDSIPLINATLLIWNQSTGEFFNYFVKEFIDVIENVDGNVFTGDLESLKTAFDGNAMIIQENGGGSPLDFRFNFSNIDERYNNYSVHVVADYTGAEDHDVDVDIFNYTSNSFLNLLTIPESGIGTIFLSEGLKTSDIVKDGNATIRVHHIENGNPSHILFLGHIGLHSENNTKKVININNNTETGITATLTEGVFEWNYEVRNNISQSIMNESNLTFTVLSDQIPPLITFINPTPDNNSVLTDKNIIINVTTNEILINISLNLSDGRIFEMVRLTAFEFQTNLTNLLDNNIQYFYNVTGTDIVGNINITGTRSLNTTFPIIILPVTISEDQENINEPTIIIFIMLIFLIIFLYHEGINSKSYYINMVTGLLIIIIDIVLATNEFTYTTYNFLANTNTIETFQNITVHNITNIQFTNTYTINLVTFGTNQILIAMFTLMGISLIARSILLSKDNGSFSKEN